MGQLNTLKGIEQPLSRILNPWRTLHLFDSFPITSSAFGSRNGYSPLVEQNFREVIVIEKTLFRAQYHKYKALSCLE